MSNVERARVKQVLVQMGLHNNAKHGATGQHPTFAAFTMADQSDYDKLSKEERDAKDKYDRQREAEEQAGEIKMLLDRLPIILHIRTMELQLCLILGSSNSAK